VNKKFGEIMQLYLVRHGIAIDREDPKCPAEAERHLTEEESRKRERSLAASRHSWRSRICFHFSYVRAAQTADLFAAAMKYPKQKIRKTNLLLPGSEAADFSASWPGIKTPSPCSVSATRRI